jgi:phage shock protein A
MRSKLEEAKSRQAMLIARSQMAKTQKDLAQSMGGMTASSALDKFDRMEEKISQQEAEAAAFTEISGEMNSSDAESFEELERNAKVDLEMQRLMAEMGMGTSDKDLDAQLAALQQEVSES